MIPQILFWAGLWIGVGVGVVSFFGGSKQNKVGPVFFPFVLLAAAAVAKYLGY